MERMNRKTTGLVSKFRALLLILIFPASFCNPSYGQGYDLLTVDTAITFQTITGFGGSLAYYEGWVTAHPNKNLIYQALFGELGLDILRLRNAHEYDPGMIDRAAEFVRAAETVRGKPVAVLSTSWGPPASLKSNNDRNNGGTLKYNVIDGKVEFDYAAFAHWWNASLDEYNAHGIFPDYISIQNEPDWTASYESCRLNPVETITSSDTIAGYNRALLAVYDSVHTRTVIPKMIGPETIGIGYNALENYCNPSDLSKIYAIAHHLYHGVDENNPYASTSFKKVGDYRPDIPHFQSEYSRGDWWSLAGMLYMSLSVENAAAYLYWDLAWDGSGLISLDFPWDRSRWTHPSGFNRTKEFYAFKQYSAFIHPGWKRVSASITGQNSVVSAFLSPGEDSASVVVINRSLSGNLLFKLVMPGFSIDAADFYVTSATENCEYKGNRKNKLVSIPPKSIATVSVRLSGKTDTNIPVDSIAIHPVSDSVTTYMDSVLIMAEIFPPEASDKTLFWEVIPDGQVAGIAQDGSLTAQGIANGEVTIRATATDGSGVYADTFVTVINQVRVASISLTAPETIIDKPQGGLQLTASVLPDDAFNRDLVWEIHGDTAIASVSQEGLLKANGKGDGNVTVRASALDGSGIYNEVSIQITNQVAVTEIVLSAADTVISEFMGTLKIVATVVPENASSKKVIWSLVTAQDLASVSQDGLLTATGEGNGEVMVRVASASSPEIFGEMRVTLSNQVNSVELNKQNGFRVWAMDGRLNYVIPANSHPIQILVCTMDGKFVKTGEIPAGTVQGDMAIHELEKGIYLVLIRSSEDYHYSKIIIF